VRRPTDAVELVISNRTILRLLFVATSFVALLYVLYLVRHVIVLVLISTFLALALNPLVQIAQRRLNLGRGTASVLVFGLVLLAFFAFLAALLTPLYNEVRAFSEDVPGYITDLQSSRLFRDLDKNYDVLDRLREQAETLPSRLPNTASSLLGLAGAVFTAILEFVTVLFLTLFLLLEMPAIARSILGLLLPPQAERVAGVAAEVNTTVARYVAGNLFISLIAGVVTFASLSILGVPFAIVLALLMALFDLIPLIGATIGSVLIVLVSFTQGVTAGIVMIVVMLVYQQLENQLIQPIVMKRSVSVSPFIVIVSVLAGSTLLGVLGALLAIPAAGSIQIALREVLEARRRTVDAQRAALEAGAAP
jgi:predicted PurR-regulated permease PerM